MKFDLSKIDFSLLKVPDLDLEEFNDIMKYEPERILQVSDFHLENIGHITDSSNRAGCYIRKFKC